MSKCFRSVVQVSKCCRSAVEVFSEWRSVVKVPTPSTARCSVARVATAPSGIDEFRTPESAKCAPGRGYVGVFSKGDRAKIPARCIPSFGGARRHVSPLLARAENGPFCRMRDLVAKIPAGCIPSFRGTRRRVSPLLARVENGPLKADYT